MRPTSGQQTRTIGGRAEGEGMEVMDKEGGLEKLGQVPPRPCPPCAYRVLLGLKHLEDLGGCPQVPAPP